MRTKLPLRAAGVVALSALAAACTVGPNYHRPTAAISTHFKEADGWRPAHPVDAIDKGAWWSVFSDPVLDGLERKVEINNQNIAQAVAAYREAHQLTAEARASFFPTLGATGQVHEQYSGSKGGSSVTTASGAIISSSGGGNSPITTYSAALTSSWSPDLWGSIRREVEGDVATAQADAAQIANARLSAQGELATDYFGLRVNDATQQVLRDTVAADQKFLDITKNQYAAGTMDRAAIITAQTQVLGVQAQLVDLQSQRAQFEHAIAMLIGVAPSELTIAPIAKSDFDVPVPPVSLPSDLLERRPDIANAERNMDAANAQIGVKVAAFYPTLPLTASYSYSGSQLSNLFSASNELWTAGANLTDTIIDFGARRAAVRAARAAYDEQVAVYRQTVLSAFQGVEDNLAALRTFQQEADVRKQALDSANYAVQLNINEYKAGTVDYTTVITAQTTALADAQAVLTLEQERLQASVSLIQNLGGGWQATELPKG